MSTDIAVARPGYLYDIDVSLVVKNCPICSILYAVPHQMMTRCTSRNESWYCPNGHCLHIIETKLDQERKRAEKAERQARGAEDAARRWRANADRERRAAAAYKGHLTRMRKRVANGVCPVPGCKRSGFDRVMAHIATRHADWLAEHPELQGDGP